MVTPAQETVPTPRFDSVYNPLERGILRLMTRRKRKRTFFDLYERLKSSRGDVTPFRNRHEGERCFIMGGGPSLKKIDPTFLKSEITFGVNGVFLIFDWLGFQPDYYAVEDRLVFEDRWNDIRKFVTKPECFFSIQFACPQFDRPNHHYLRSIYDFDPAAGFPRFSEDVSKVVWIGGTVTYVCMQLAFYMGFQEVYLIGMDHNYARPDHVQAEGNVWTSHGEDPNHFHPDYFGKGYRWHDPKVDRMETAYRKAKDVFEAHGRKIYNATAGGQLEVFERVNYNDLF
ncbi:MAG: DUF115 domain-containing protein [Sumerlaeia bacterium]